MNFGLNGITSLNLLNSCNSWQLDRIGFDLRPRSFNFIQKEKIKKWLGTHLETKQIKILMTTSPDILFDEFWKEFSILHPGIIFELDGVSNFDIFRDKSIPFSFVLFNLKEIKTLRGQNTLKEIVISNELLTELIATNEVYGLTALLDDFNCNISLQMNWNMDLPQSVLDSLKISSLDFQVTPEVEISYQNPNIELIENVFVYLINYFEEKGSSEGENSYI